MTEEDFYADYYDGRKDFSNVNLQGIDFFTPIIRRTHPELFSEKISTLVQNKNPVIEKPLSGIELHDASLGNVNILDANLLAADVCRSSLTNIDARFCSISGSFLSDVNLEGADLRGSTFIGTTLLRANLNNSKLDHSLFQWTKIKDSTFEGASAVGARITNSIITNSIFKCCNFEGCDLSQTHIHSSNLNGSSFERCKFWNTELYDNSLNKCNFSFATIHHSLFANSSINSSKYENASIYNSKLSSSDLACSVFKGGAIKNTKITSLLLDGVSFTDVVFDGNQINKPNIYNTKIGGCSFIGQNLSCFLSRQIIHTGISHIDYFSLARTISARKLHPLDIDSTLDIQRFVENCGTPPVVAVYLIDSIRSLSSDQLISLMESTFISYGTPDEQFAKRLNQDLMKYGVLTFFFPTSATFGEKLYSTMSRVNDYDRIILVCSKQSLNRPGLRYELEKTIEREAREGVASRLIPIALDDYLFTEWQPNNSRLREEVLSRVVADFRDNDTYQLQFQRLLNTLKK